jgi:uncharacterized HAD superfamily protein
MASVRSLIAIDIDDVLLPHFADLIAWHNRTYGTQLTLADNGSEDLEKWGAESVEQAIRRVQAYFETEEFAQAQPFAEAREVLVRLAERYELVVITARDTVVEALTRDWLERHFSAIFREAHFTAKYSLEGKRRHKADVLREIGAAYLIDDALENIYAAGEAGVQAVLFGNYPWNQADLLPDGVVRCVDWAAVEEYFDGLSA